MSLLGFSEKLYDLMLEENSQKWRNLVWNNIVSKTFFKSIEFIEDIRKLRLIRLAISRGLTEEQILMFARPEFDFLQMFIISNSFNTLSTEQIKFIAKPKLTVEEMQEIKACLEHS